MRTFFFSLVITFLQFSTTPLTTHAEPLRVMGTENIAPFSFMENGTPSGFNIDILHAIARTKKLDTVVTLETWAKARAAIETGEIDILIDMTYTPERDKSVDFSKSFRTVYYSAFIREDSDISDVNDLNDKTIIVMRDDIALEWIDGKLFPKELVLVSSVSEGLMLLSNGQFDAFLCGGITGLIQLKKHLIQNIVTLDDNILSFESRFAVKEGNADLVLALNDGIELLKQSGQYEIIYDKWFGSLELKSATPSQVKKYFIIGFLSIFSFIALFSIWSWTLKLKVNSKTQELKQMLKKYQKKDERHYPQTKFQNETGKKSKDATRSHAEKKNRNIRRKVVKQKKQTGLFSQRKSLFSDRIKPFVIIIFIAVIVLLWLWIIFLNPFSNY